MIVQHLRQSINFMEDSFKFLKGCLLQNLLSPLLNTLSHLGEEGNEQCICAVAKRVWCWGGVWREGYLSDSPSCYQGKFLKLEIQHIQENTTSN